MENFEFKLKTRVYFGNGLAGKTGDICKELGMTKVMIISGRHVSKLPLMRDLEQNLSDKGIDYETFFEVKPDPDVDGIDELSNKMKAFGADGAIAIGGGSPLDAGKAACLLQTNEGKAEEYVFGGGKTITKAGVPIICIPTTAGTGSEVTTVSVLSNHRTMKKASISSPFMAPAVAILDPMVTLDAPKGVTASTGVDALTHAIEAYVCKKANPYSDMCAEKAISIIGKYLIPAYENGQDIEARANMLVASNFAALAFSHSGLGAVHGISQSIGGIANTAHGITNAVLLPYVKKMNYEGNAKKYDHIEELLGMDIESLCRKLNIPEKISELGVTEDMFQKIIDETMIYRQLAMNPVTVTEEFVAKVLRDSI